MALTKEIVVDKIEIVGEFRNILVREATVIKEDGVEVARRHHKKSIAPDSDTSKESEDIKALVNQFHTTKVKNDYTAYMESIMAEGEIVNEPI